MNNDYCAPFEQEVGEQGEEANRYAEDKLIPPESYKDFLKSKNFTTNAIKAFAENINRNVGIIVGRLQNDNYVGHDNLEVQKLRHKIIFRKA